MQRLLSLFACFAILMSANLLAANTDSPADMTFTSAEELTEAGLVSPLLAMNMKEIECKDDVVLQTIEGESETFECCNQDARFEYAARTVKDLVYKVTELCKEEGCDLSAIAQICVNYKAVTDEKCVAVVTVTYRCCCCIISRPDVDGCKYDDKVCPEHGVEKISHRKRYKCCEVDSRWNAIYDTMKESYSEADAKCSVLRCVGDLIVRGFQVDFFPVNSADGVCGVESTIFYSCCCVCAY